MVPHAAVAPVVAARRPPEESAGEIISLIVPVVRRADDLGAIYDAFAAALSPITLRYEFLFVFDGGFGPPPDALVARSRKDRRVRILRPEPFHQRVPPPHGRDTPQLPPSTPPLDEPLDPDRFYKSLTRFS